MAYDEDGVMATLQLEMMKIFAIATFRKYQR